MRPRLVAALLLVLIAPLGSGSSALLASDFSAPDWNAWTQETKPGPTFSAARACEPSGNCYAHVYGLCCESPYPGSGLWRDVAWPLDAHLTVTLRVRDAGGPSTSAAYLVLHMDDGSVVALQIGRETGSAAAPADRRDALLAHGGARVELGEHALGAWRHYALFLDGANDTVRVGTGPFVRAMAGEAPLSPSAASVVKVRLAVTRTTLERHPFEFDDVSARIPSAPQALSLQAVSLEARDATTRVLSMKWYAGDDGARPAYAWTLERWNAATARWDVRATAGVEPEGGFTWHDDEIAFPDYRPLGGYRYRLTAANDLGATSIERCFGGDPGGMDPLDDCGTGPRSGRFDPLP